MLAPLYRMVEFILPDTANFRIVCTVSQHHLIPIMQLSAKAIAEKSE